MTSIKYGAAAQNLSGTKAGDEAIINIIETPLAGTPNPVGSTFKDANITTTTTSGTTNNFRIDVQPNSSGGYTQFAFINNASSIATVDSAGNVARVASGTADITVVAPPSLRKVQRVLSNSSSVVTVAWNSWVTGTLAKHIEDSISAMFAGHTPGAGDQAVLSSSSGGYSSPNHIRNTNIFTGSLDLTSISVYGAAYGSNILPVVLISPRHVIAGHAGTQPGYPWVFKDSAGNYQVRTVSSQIKIASDFGDNYVGLLDSQITTITPIKTLPSNWASYIPSEDHNPGVTYLPVLNKAFANGDWIRVLGWYGTPVSSNPYPMYLQPHNRAPFSSWTSAVVGGDSNGPVFVPINGNPVLLHCMNYTFGGSFYPSRITQIQAAMDSLLSGQTLGTANLAGFTTF